MTPDPQPPAVLVMARWWGEADVKTRLAAGIGRRAAQQVYRAMVERQWTALAHERLERHLWVTPAARVTEADHWLPGADVVRAQPFEGAGADLGECMLAAFEHALADECRPWAAVVGTDAPRIDAAWVLEAGALLAEHDVVMTPTLDGGYALLASRTPHPELFGGMPWSTDRVAELTRRRAGTLRLKLAETAPVRDLDDRDDLRALVAEGLVEWPPR